MKKWIWFLLTLGLNAQSLPPMSSSSSHPAESKPSTTPTKPLSAEEKSGFLLGVHGSFGSNNILQDFAFTPNPNIKVTDGTHTNIKWLWTEGVYMRNSRNQSMLAFDGGLTLGYQHYFTPRMGLRVSTYASVGLPIDGQIRSDMSGYVKEPIPDGNSSGGKPTEAIPFIDYEALLQSAYLPLRFSVDFDFLLDFLNQGKHTLGVTAGIGYRFGYYLNQKGKSFHGKAQDAWGGSLTYTQTDKSLKLKDFLTHDLYPKLGLHYYYGNHQFELLLKMNGLLESFLQHKEIIEIKDAKGAIYRYEMRITNTSPLSLSYAYRF